MVTGEWWKAGEDISNGLFVPFSSFHPCPPGNVLYQNGTNQYRADPIAAPSQLERRLCSSRACHLPLAAPIPSHRYLAHSLNSTPPSSYSIVRYSDSLHPFLVVLVTRSPFGKCICPIILPATGPSVPSNLPACSARLCDANHNLPRSGIDNQFLSG